MTDETKAWLKALNADIWTTKNSMKQVGYLREPCVYYEEARRLTPEEWDRLEAVLRDERPMVELVNSGWGFGCAVRVYDDPIDPPYPGVPPLVPDLLLVVDKNHLPLEGRIKEVPSLGRKKKVVPADRTTFEDGWRAFSPYTHPFDNGRRLVACGLPLPQPKSYYEY